MPHPLSPAHLNALNLKVLRRHCPTICDIYDQASYVVLYRSILRIPGDTSSREWSKKEVHVEGSMFLVEYETAPKHGFYILNREGLNDFKHVFQKGDKFEFSSDFIIFQTQGESEVWGLWVFEPDQRKRLGKKFLYYHKLESNPGLVLPPDSPVALPNGELQPQTIDELFERLTLPKSAPANANAADASRPPAAGAKTGSDRRGRKRGESVSKVAQTQLAEVQQEQRLEQVLQQYPSSTKAKKGKGVQRPRSVPPTEANMQQQQPVPPVPGAGMKGKGPASGPNGLGIGHGAGLQPSHASQQVVPLPHAAPLPRGAPPPHDATSMSLMQLFGIGAAATSAPADTQTEAGQVGAQPACTPRADGSFSFPPRQADGGLTTSQPQARQPQQSFSATLPKPKHARPKSTQYIPQSSKEEKLLVDIGAVKESVVDRMQKTSTGLNAKEAVSQREFVEEVLRLIHTDKVWTKGLYEDYIAKRQGSAE